MSQLLKFKIRTPELKNIPIWKRKHKAKTQTPTILSRSKRHNIRRKSKTMPRTNSQQTEVDSPRSKTRVIQRIKSAILDLHLIIRN